ncbi:hypothetical protein DFH08DRAFT_815820 [Mycena albidolilacea]|uniref:Uncharacterized protein n=1 Tax=Mycena albidolilacea TaxID=1033008 RepID=A0AAD6ZMK3_9AGAR|nr:hypothetical protein DFH08DRAFT_815820 [Mycena albidolilacea]
MSPDSPDVQQHGLVHYALRWVTKVRGTPEGGPVIKETEVLTNPFLPVFKTDTKLFSWKRMQSLSTDIGDRITRFRLLSNEIGVCIHCVKDIRTAIELILEAEHQSKLAGDLMTPQSAPRCYQSSTIKDQPPAVCWCLAPSLMPLSIEVSEAPMLRSLESEP